MSVYRKTTYTDHDFLPHWNHKPFYQTGHEAGSISDSAPLPTPSVRLNSSIKTNRSKINKKEFKYLLFLDIIHRNDLK